MKTMKKVFALLLCMVMVALVFAGCSKSETAEEITSETLLVAYKESNANNAPFIYTDENGELAGFDVELIETIFKDIKNDFKNYQFIEVPDSYRVGEDAAYIDEDGNQYIAYIEVGGIAMDEGTVNEDYSMTESIIDNRVIAVTADSTIANYTDLAGKKAAIVSDTAANALEKFSALRDGFASADVYDDAASAIADLTAGKVDVIIIDEFNYCVAEGTDNLNVLESELDTVHYVYGFKKYDWYKDSVNTAIMELHDPEYNGSDDLTPLVEKYFGYDATNFTYDMK